MCKPLSSSGACSAFRGLSPSEARALGLTKRMPCWAPVLIPAKSTQCLKPTSVSVTKRRRALKIPHFWDRPWTAKEDRLLGTSTDHQLAHELGRSTRQVRVRRRKLGILPWIYMARDWTTQEERMLGKECDYAIAKRLGRSLTAIRAKRRAGIPLRTTEDRRALGLDRARSVHLYPVQSRARLLWPRAFLCLLLSRISVRLLTHWQKRRCREQISVFGRTR